MEDQAICRPDIHIDLSTEIHRQLSVP